MPRIPPLKPLHPSQNTYPVSGDFDAVLARHQLRATQLHVVWRRGELLVKIRAEPRGEA